MSGFDLARWAQQAGFSPRAGGPQDLVAISEGEVGFYIAAREGRFVVERTERGTTRQWQGTFPSEDAAKVFLIALIGRASLRPDSPSLAPEPADKPPEGELIHCRGAEFPASYTGRYYARLFEQVADATPNQLATSYTSPKGKPLFA